MEREGFLSPETPEAARRAHAELVPVASTVVSETARAMDFDGEERERRLTDDVVATAHDALFASLLEIQVGTMDEFEDWRADYDGPIAVEGSEHVPNVVWHAPAFDDRAIAATFADERAAAVATLRRMAFGRIYADVVGER